MSDALIIHSPTSDLARYKLGRETAMTAAIQGAGKDLSIDEQFLIASTLKKLARAGDLQPGKFAHTLPVRVSIAAFAKYFKVDDVTAMRRLEEATDALFNRTCRAVYPGLEREGDVETQFRWIDSKVVCPSFVKFTWTARFAREFVRAHETAKLEGVKTPTLAFGPTKLC